MTSGRYRIELVREVEKDLKRLRPWTEHATRHLLRLEGDPLAGHLLTGFLRGTRSLEFSLRGGDAYRAVYVVLEDAAVCVILIVGPHENVYERAERRYRAWLKRRDERS